MKMKGIGWTTTAATVAVALLLSGCSGNSTDGTPVTDAAETTTTSQLTPLINPEQSNYDPDLMVGDVPVTVLMESPVNAVVVKAANDTTEFWDKELVYSFEAPTSYTAMPAASDTDACTIKLDYARMCPDGMIWEVPDMERISERGGEGSVLVAVAHEMGHQVQMSMGRENREREADCLAGIYMRSVQDGTSPRFKGNDERVRVAARNAFDVVQNDNEAVVTERMQAFNDGLRTGSVEQCAALHP